MGRKRKEGEAKRTIFVNLRKKVVEFLETKGNAGKVASEVIESWYEKEQEKEKEKEQY